MDKKQRLHLLGVYNYTVILTYVGMLFAFAGIHFVFSNNDRSFILALLCLMIAGLMDMFDGKVASTKKTVLHLRNSSEFKSTQWQTLSAMEFFLHSSFTSSQSATNSIPSNIPGRRES